MAAISRRGLLGAIGAALALGRAKARAESELTFATWGGSEIADLNAAFIRSFSRSTGIQVVFDGTGPSEGKISAMVDAGQVDWDVCDVDGHVAQRLERADVLSAIDYDIVDRNAVLPGYARLASLCGYTYSFVLAYDSTLYRERPPFGWGDFFDVKRYPGRRAIWKWMIGGFEAAAMAGGAPIGSIYPMDIEDVVDRLTALGPDLVLWETGDHAKQMLLDRTIAMACVWHSRAAQAAKESEGGIAWSFDQGLLCPGTWVVPRRNPGGVDAFRLLAWMQDPERQIALTRARALGPANPAAIERMPDDLRWIDPGQPDAMARQAMFDSDWWADQYDHARVRFQDRFGRS
jgi:putative spermidine/putrescine transport system substrate-binding protein